MSREFGFKTDLRGPDERDIRDYQERLAQYGGRLRAVGLGGVLTIRGLTVGEEFEDFLRQGHVYTGVRQMAEIDNWMGGHGFLSTGNAARGRVRLVSDAILRQVF